MDEKTRGLLEEYLEAVCAFKSVENAKKKFLVAFDDNGLGNETYLLQALQESYLSKDPGEVELAVLLGFLVGFTMVHFEVLSALLVADWHYRHEDIVSALDRFRDPKTIEALFVAAQQKHDYLEFDEAHALAVKAIWGLGNLAHPEAMEKLRLLAKSDIEVIKRNSLEQLARTHHEKSSSKNHVNQGEWIYFDNKEKGFWKSLLRRLRLLR